MVHDTKLTHYEPLGAGGYLQVLILQKIVICHFGGQSIGIPTDDFSDWAPLFFP